MTVIYELQQTIEDLTNSCRGILAADESENTIGQRFKAVGAASTEENRRWYRSMLLSTLELGSYIGGVIFFEETLTQKDSNGTLLPELAIRQKIVPGIKVDKGKGALAGAEGDLISYGLDGLGERLADYKKQGARFAKWREVYPISDTNPTSLGLAANAEVLARYAAVCQSAGIVPIVEPEVLIDGSHSMDRAAGVSEQVLHSVFHALYRHSVSLELMILKPSMVTPGTTATKATAEEVAEVTLRTLRRTVPAAVPSINFLSGGQAPAEATANLNALNQRSDQAPWKLSLSFSRALQEPVLEAWAGDNRNMEKAQAAFLKRVRLNSLALRGEYHPKLE